MRNTYISLDECFMTLAIGMSARSKDRDRQVGACIVSPDNRVISSGYNGMPRGIRDTIEHWSDSIKKLYVVHAELNAILNAKQDLTNCKIYCTLKPCNECSKAIAQSGITEVIYLEDFKSDHEFMIVSNIILESNKIIIRKYGDINENKK